PTPPPYTTLFRSPSRPTANVTEFGKHLEVAPGAAAKIEYRERRHAFDVLQQRPDVLADVVIARALPEFFGTLIVMLEREVGDLFQVLRIQVHVRSIAPGSSRAGTMVV